MLKQIEKTLEKIECEGEKPTIDAAMKAMWNIHSALNRLKVSGRDNIDMLFGCMMAIEQIIGEEE